MLYHILDMLASPILRALEKKLPKCKRCGGKPERQENPRLFLIPAAFGDVYEPTAEYYLLNGKPIGGLSQIPTGQRACRFIEIVCASCGHSQILAEDFLRVRDTEVVKMRTLFDHDELNGLFSYAKNSR